ncbi:MAG: type II toxin-antitoxin system VapC family toxin [Verrucomicrobia bacterium]|nr:type II toxin-antitoxin system VapC family toxin [Verrucomicrobiota bacterium]
MNLLLDTCALIALAYGMLTPRARQALLAAPEAILSPVTVWELAIKVKSGKLRLPDPPLVWVEQLVARHGLLLSASDLRPALLCAAADLPLIHRDPFDRVLVATALARHLTIITSDEIIPTYPGIKTLW